MSELQLHSFEAGRRGKPDELDSAIANLIAAEFLEINPDARFDIRVSGGYSLDEDKPKIRVSGEVSDLRVQPVGKRFGDISHPIGAITGNVKSRLTDVITRHYNEVHGTNLEAKDFLISYEFKPQASALTLNGHAGDSGNPIAVAYREGPKYLPWERYAAVNIRDHLDEVFQLQLGHERKRGGKGYSDELERNILSRKFKADGKVAVDAVYDQARLVEIKNIVIAVEHEPFPNLIDDLRWTFEGGLGSLLGVGNDHSLYKNASLVVNGLGPWHSGGWRVDEGSREAKSYRDGFASYGCCEDSFSGEDPTKPSGTGTFLARYIAVNIVAAGLADFARVALTYTIGREEVGLNVTTQNTAKIPQEELHTWVRKKFQLRIKDAIELFGLKDPNLYRRFAQCSDYFQDPTYPWNRTVPSKETT